MLYAITWPLMKGFMRLIFAVLGGFRVIDARHVPRTGGVLICPNHMSDADPPAVAVALPRNAWFMAKEELFDVPILGALMRLWHGFPIRRNSADRAALRRAESLLQAGEAVVIFPEGGGNPDARLQPLNPGALLVALRTGVPVVPVAIRHTHLVWPYGATSLKRSPSPVTVTFGEPLDLSDLRGVRGGVDKATERLATALATMLGQEVPEGRPQVRTEAPYPPAKDPQTPAG